MPPESLEQSSDETELATILGLYALGELTLGEAAKRADVSRIRMQEILHEAGISLRLGPETEDDARREIDVARRRDE